MVTDPWGNRTVPGGLADAGPGAGRDPGRDLRPGGRRPARAYTVNGYLVSDFSPRTTTTRSPLPGCATASPGRWTARARSSEGGYLSWRDPATGEWWQCDRVQRERAHVPAPRARSTRTAGPFVRGSMCTPPMRQLFTGTSRERSGPQGGLRAPRQHPGGLAGARGGDPPQAWPSSASADAAGQVGEAGGNSFRVWRLRAQMPRATRAARTRVPQMPRWLSVGLQSRTRRKIRATAP